MKKVGAEVELRAFNFPRFERFGEGEDLPEVPVIPHELAASEEGAAFEGDTFSVGGDVGFRCLVREAVHADDGTCDSLRSDFAKEDVMGSASPRCGDLDALSVGIRLPTVCLLGGVKNVSDKLSAAPCKVRNVFSREEDDSGLVRQFFWKNEACAVGENGGVGIERNRLGSFQVVVPGGDCDAALLGQELE